MGRWLRKGHYCDLRRLHAEKGWIERISQCRPARLHYPRSSLCHEMLFLGGGRRNYPKQNVQMRFHSGFSSCVLLCYNSSELTAVRNESGCLQNGHRRRLDVQFLLDCKGG